MKKFLHLLILTCAAVTLITFSGCENEEEPLEETGEAIEESGEALGEGMEEAGEELEEGAD